MKKSANWAADFMASCIVKVIFVGEGIGSLGTVVIENELPHGCWESTPLNSVTA
ncbi:hypothetical protein STEG23_029946, partial [Scotinomys teguina]